MSLRGVSGLMLHRGSHCVSEKQLVAWRTNLRGATAPADNLPVSSTASSNDDPAHGRTLVGQASTVMGRSLDVDAPTGASADISSCDVDAPTKASTVMARFHEIDAPTLAWLTLYLIYGI